MNSELRSVAKIATKCRYVVFSATVVTLMLLNTAVARAGCGEPFRAGSVPKLSWMDHQAGDEQGTPATIVGLWHVKYTAADGSAFLESFKTWHRDGTEFEQAFLPPVAGNVCFGVWKAVGQLVVKLHHVGLMFNPDGSIKATFTVDEVDTVAADNTTYKGAFDFKVFDLGGNLLQEVKGTTAGARISVN